MKKTWNAYNTSGYKVPEGYFEALESRVADRLDLEALHHKKEGFQVPEGYFHNFEVKQPTQKKLKVLRLTPNVIAASWAAVAAALILMLFIWNPAAPVTNNVESLSSASLNDYFEYEGIQDYITAEELSKIEDNTNFIESINVSDDLIFDMINKDVLEEELEPSLVEN